MQVRRAQLPRHTHRQRLAASGIAKTVFWIFLSLSRQEDCTKMIVNRRRRRMRAKGGSERYDFVAATITVLPTKTGTLFIAFTIAAFSSSTVRYFLASLR